MKLTLLTNCTSNLNIRVKASNVLNLFGKFFIKSKRGTDADTNKEVQGIWLLHTSDDTI